MTEPEVKEVIMGAIKEFDDIEDYASMLAPAIIGALSVAGYAIVRVDADVLHRVVSEMHHNGRDA